MKTTKMDIPESLRFLFDFKYSLIIDPEKWYRVNCVSDWSMFKGGRYICMENSEFILEGRKIIKNRFGIGSYGYNITDEEEIEFRKLFTKIELARLL